MWLRPRETIRHIVHTNPRRGAFCLSALYIFQLLFFLFNFWSLGLFVPHYTLLIPSALATPFLALAWLSVYSRLLEQTGRWFGGRAPLSHLKAVSAWSRLPLTLSLILWGGLWLSNPREVFIQFGPGNTALLMQASLLILKGWTAALLVQSLREVQQFSLAKALLNALASWAIYFLVFISMIFCLRILSFYLSQISAYFFN